MGSEDQALTVHSKKSRMDYHHHKGKHSHWKYNPRRSNIALSSIRCFTCDEAGHYARNCPKKQKLMKRSNKRRHHAHAAEDDEPSKKRTDMKVKILHARMNMF